MLNAEAPAKWRGRRRTKGLSLSLKNTAGISDGLIS